MREDYSTTSIVDKPENEIKMQNNAFIPVFREVILEQLNIQKRETNCNRKSLIKKFDFQKTKSIDPVIAFFNNSSLIWS